MSIQKDTKTEDIKFEIIKLKCQALIWITLHIKKTEDAKFVMQPLFFYFMNFTNICGRCSVYAVFFCVLLLSGCKVQ